jgi:S1-C subfamily serine protease
MKTLIFLAAFGLLAVSSRPVSAADDLRESVVQIHATIRPPNFFEPWAKQSPQKITGTGVIIDDKHILTNAHMVNYAAEILIEPFESGKKTQAKVIGIAPGMDLALLEPRDLSAIAKRPPMPRAKKLPSVRDAVSVYGYPIGGTGLSITKGIISRIEYADYSYSDFGLRMQVDAAINPGNSGGPAIADDKMIGLAFAGLEDSENIGYIVPNEEIELFLADMADGKYDGKRSIHDDIQTLESDALRASLGMAPGMTGVLVTNIRRSEHGTVLRPRDVILKVNGETVENDGMIRLKGDVRWSFLYLAGKWAKDNKIPITVLRQGKPVELTVTLEPEPEYVIKPLHDQYPRYFVYGPFVFTTASVEFVQGLRQVEENRDELLDRHSSLVTRFNEDVTFHGEELVAVAAVLPHKISEGYEDDFRARVVSHVNGTAVKNLPHLVQLLRDSKEKYIEFKFGENTQPLAVLDRQAVAEATEDILADNGVRQPYSADLRDLWLNKPPAKAASDKSEQKTENKAAAKGPTIKTPATPSATPPTPAPATRPISGKTK